LPSLRKQLATNFTQLEGNKIRKWLLIEVLWCIGKLVIIAFRTRFPHVNMFSTHLAIQFRVFEPILNNDAGREVELITYLLYLFWAILKVIGCVRKL